MDFDIFISYSSKDKSVADAVCSRLESAGVRCWIAPRDVLPGRSYGEAIIEAIHQARVMVLVFSANANSSSHIAKEVERAVSNGLAILPFRIEDVTPGKSLDYFIGSVHWLDAMTPPLERHLEELVTTVHKLLPGERKVPPVPLSPVAPLQIPAQRRTTPPSPPAQASASSAKIWIAIAALAVILIIGIGALWMRSNRAPETSDGVPGGSSVSMQPGGRASAGNLPQTLAGDADAIVGCYHWFNNQPVVIHSNGTMTGGPFTARWRLLNGASRTYSFTWPEATDTVSVASDQQSLRGANQYGFPTSGTRITPGIGLVGTWRWPNGVPVVVLPDGTFTAATFRGTWKAADATRGVYALTWPNPVDRVTLSRDGSHISGSNQYGVAISGTRTLPCSEN